MKPHRHHHFLSLAPVLALSLAGPTSAADLFWDGGTANIIANGDGASTFTGGAWNTGIANWDQGAAPHVPWTNANLDTAIFGGLFGTGTKSSPSAPASPSIKSRS